jgi:ABC-type dipeptide/oligopeptide/nickel transport system ATPase component
VNGEVTFKGRNLLQLSEREMRDLRGNDIGMIFQEPMTSLDPLYTVGDQIGEALFLHQGCAARPPATPPFAPSPTWASPTPSGASTRTRTRCRAECGSAS